MLTIFVLFLIVADYSIAAWSYFVFKDTSNMFWFFRVFVVISGIAVSALGTLLLHVLYSMNT